MAGTPVVKLGGLVLGGATSYDWEMLPGTRAVARDYTLTSVPPGALETMQNMLGTARHFSITNVRKPLNVEQVNVIGIYPGEDPSVVRLAVMDRRWLWAKKNVTADFNVRRATGDRFLENEEVIENAVLLPEIQYAYYSLNNGVKHTVQSMLQKIFTQLQTAWRFEDNTDAATFGDVEIENLQLDDDGDDALERALNYLPGADVYIDNFGVAVIYDTARRLAPVPQSKQQVGRGFSAMADLRALRPRYVDVLFTREAEMRFNFRGARLGATVPLTKDSNQLVNVMPVVESQLVVDGKKLARGSWAPIDDMIAAWGPTPTGRVLDQAVIRLLYMQGRLGGLALYVCGVAQAVNPIWLRRVDMLSAHWRKTFQVEPRFWSRVAGMRATRASLINYATGARAPAEAYCDFIRRPSYSARNFQEVPEITDRTGWVVEGYNDLLQNSQPAPVKVSVIDPDAGVIQLQPTLDPDGAVDAVTLGKPNAAFDLPPAHLGELNRAVQVFRRWDQIVLADDWRMSVVLTTIPASPNDNRKFYRVRVNPTNVPFGLSKADCIGPPIEMRVFGGIVTALMPWSDSDAVQMVEAFQGNATWPEDRVSNFKHLRDIASATAARIYEQALDRPYGSATFDMDPDFALRGNMRSVRHDMRGGATTTTVTYGAPPAARSIWRYLDASTRRVINRNLAAGKEGTS